MMEPIDTEALCAPFPQEAVHWRAQTVTKDGTRALALAYLDARNVMDRLDSVCGPENWQDEYASANGRTICKIGIKINNEWVWKSDGAGDTKVEAEKGGISDAFKRAAVKWGIGRYLYGIETPWVPCESYEKDNKKHFKKFTKDPWSVIEQIPLSNSPGIAAKRAQEMEDALLTASNLEELQTIWQGKIAPHYKALSSVIQRTLTTTKDERKAVLQEQAA